MTNHPNDPRKVALVFGISGEQGQAVAIGLLATHSYLHIYGVTRDISEDHVRCVKEHLDRLASVPIRVQVNTDLSNLDKVDESNEIKPTTKSDNYITLLRADLNSPYSIQTLLQTTCATDIFLVTTTDVPPEDAAVGSFHECEEREFECIKNFFDVMVEVHSKDEKKVERRVVFSTLDNVKGLVEWLEFHGDSSQRCGSDGDDCEEPLRIKPLDDGGIVPHYSGKGRGGEYALKLIHGVADPWHSPPSGDTGEAFPWKTSKSPIPSIIPGLAVTLITLPFLHSNFSRSAVPLPITNSATTSSTNNRTTQWSITACLGDPTHPLDLFSITDLQYIVPHILCTPNYYQLYQGRKMKLSAEKISLEEVAYKFSDLFGKDVIYSPLTVEEMGALEDGGDGHGAAGVPGARALAQMCQYLVSPYANVDDEDMKETKEIVMSFTKGKEPQTFEDWLLTHSDDEGFERVGLSLDAIPIQCVAVFDATSLQGESVIKGLLVDTRKKYTIRACIIDNDGADSADEGDDPIDKEQVAQRITSLDPDNRITVHFCNLNNIESCRKAVEGADGAFVVTDFYNYHQQQSLSSPEEREETEIKHAQAIIDACAAFGSVRHIVLSTLEKAEDVDNELKDSADITDCDLSDFHGSNGMMIDTSGILRQKKIVFDAKARMAAYARMKKISVTYVLMPVYSERFFKAVAGRIRKERLDEVEGEDDEDKEEVEELVSSVEEPSLGVENSDEKVVCMSVYELGPAVANIFDSYEVYAGHEIGLMTDVLSLTEATDMIQQVFFEKETTTTCQSSNDQGGLDSIPEAAFSTNTSATSLTMLSEPHYRVDTFAKDLGQMFRFYSKTEEVKRRGSVAATMELIPDAKPFRQWLEDNRNNVEFREMLGLR